jgi:hypothetical protein
VLVTCPLLPRRQVHASISFTSGYQLALFNTRSMDQWTAADVAKYIQRHGQFSSKVSGNSLRVQSTDPQLQFASFRPKKDSSPEANSKSFVLNTQVDCQGRVRSCMNIQLPHHLPNRPMSVEYASPGDCHCLVMIPPVIRWCLNACSS